MSDVIIYQGAAIPFSFSRQNGQPLDVTSVMRTLADITTYAANTEKKYVPYEGQTIACLEDKMLYILELKNGVLVPKLSGGVKLIKRDDNVELTDDAALSALRSVKEIEDRAISRTKRDTAAEPIEFKKGLTAAGGKTTVSGDGKITTLNLLVQALAEVYDLNVSHVATMMRTIIKDYVSSEAFTPGLLGEGFKISKAINGDWNLEVDNIVVRKVMTIFELVISKVRSVNGGLVISPANGRIKSVAETTGSPAYYVIGIEGDMQFVVDDYVRCQVFNGGQAKYYWVRVSSISGNSILVLKSEFTNGAVPAVGDDLVQMGNATNKARQGLIYLTASEDGKPRISVMDGVNSTSTVGKNKVILGCLDGITDTDFPADFQPSGYGLYAMNVFLKGIFVLRSGKTVEGELTTTNAAVTTAKQIADAAKELANSANALLSDIASDNKLTPSEKQATKKEWEQIVSEKVKNDASADKYGVSKVACTTAYNALSVYITPLLASLSTTSDIVGTTFRSTFKAYYDARADLLNSISAKAKELADAAQGKATEAANAAATAQAKANQANTAAGAAQSTADSAVTNAATANSLLSDIANDNKFTATEKQQTKKEWDVIVSEKPLNNASAVKFYVSTAAYDTAYNALNTYITPLLASLSTTSNIVGSDFRAKFKAYYDARTNLLNAVSEKAKRLADDAQNAANAAQAKADTVTRLFQEFTVAGGLFESKITEVKEYADGKVNALQIGGRNLLMNSKRSNLNNAWLYVSGLNDNEEVVFQMWGTGTIMTHADNGYGGGILLTTINGYGIIKRAVRPHTNHPNNNGTVLLIVSCTGEVKIKVERGNKATDWTPAPEDVAADTEAARLAAVAAQNKANEAATNAATAQTAANNAASTANAAKSRLDNWSADGSISPTEKLTLKQEQKALLDEKTQIVADAAKYAVSYTAYVTAYTNYNGELTYHTATTPEVIAIRANFATYQAAYYTAKQTILNAISVAAKKYAEDKANDAKQAAINDAAGKYPTKSEVSSSINQKADEINLSVTEKIESVQVGGRNYYKKNTPYDPQATQAKFERLVSINGFQLTGAQDVNSSIIRLLQILTSNGYWTVSFEFCGTQNVPVGFYIDVCDTGRKYFQNPSTTNEYLRVEHTVNITNYSSSVYHFIDFERITWTYITIRNFKVEKGNKATDWTPAPEDVQSQITENKSSIQALSDQIALKVSNDTFNALGNRVSSAESTLSVQATQIASKVSQSDFNALGQRVGSAESAILQQAEQISLKASKSDLNTLSGRVSSTEAELRVHATEIGMKVTAGDVSAGMTITANKITLFGKEFDLTGKITFSSMASDAQGKITAAQSSADKAITDAANSLVTSRNNIAAQLGYGNYDAMSAAAIAGKTIINGGKIRTELIDATAIVTGALVASVISATNITTGKLTVTDNAKIGEFLVQNNSLVNYDFRASLQIGDSDSLRYVKIGGDSLNLAKIQVAGENTVGLNITTYKPTVGRYPHTNYAIKSVGSHVFKQRGAVDQYDKDDIWDAPGVLWAGRIGQWGAVENSWGNGCTASSRRTSDGNYTISHDLGHNQYYVIIQCTPYATDGWRYMIGMVGGKYPTSFDVALVDTGEGSKNCAFEVFIVGRNKW